jgi:hypothetical protein
LKTNRHRTLVRFRPGNKDLGQRFADEEFAQEFLDPIKTSLNKERTPSQHCRVGHEDHKRPKE